MRATRGRIATVYGAGISITAIDQHRGAPLARANIVGAGVAVVAFCMVGRMNNLVVHFVAGIVGATNSIIDNRSAPRLASLGGITRLKTIAEQTIVALRIIGRMDNLVVDLIAGIVGAGDSITSALGGSRFTGP